MQFTKCCSQVNAENGEKYELEINITGINHLNNEEKNMLELVLNKCF